MTIMTVYVTDTLQLNVMWAGIALGVAAALEVPALLLIGRLSSRFSHLGLIATSCLAGIAYYLGLMFVTEPILLIALQPLNAWSFAGIAGIGLPLFQQMIPRGFSRKVTSAATPYLTPCGWATATSTRHGPTTTRPQSDGRCVSRAFRATRRTSPRSCREAKDYNKAIEEFETTMEEIGLDYLDLYLIHAPWPWDQMGEDCREENRQIWRAMEEFLASGRVRAIGVSNFAPEDLDSLLPACKTKPMVNQIRWFIGLNPSDTFQKCAEHGIVIEAYSPSRTA
jgi:Aldo/keto reductase family